MIISKDTLWLIGWAVVVICFVLCFIDDPKAKFLVGIVCFFGPWLGLEMYDSHQDLLEGEAVRKRLEESDRARAAQEAREHAEWESRQPQAVATRALAERPQPTPPIIVNDRDIVLRPRPTAAQKREEILRRYGTQ